MRPRRKPTSLEILLELIRGDLRELVHTIPGRLEEEIRAVKDGRAEVPEQELKRLSRKIDDAQARARHAVEQTNARVRENLGHAQRLATKTRTSRKADQATIARVRSLLERDVTADAILEQARELGDVETVAALRTELGYLARDRKPGRMTGSFVDAGEALRACDETLAVIAGGTEKQDAAAAARLPDFEKAADAAHAYAERALVGRAHGASRISMGHSLAALNGWQPTGFTGDADAGAGGAPEAASR